MSGSSVPSSVLSSFSRQGTLRKFLPRPTFIVTGARTPIGSFLGRLKSVPVHRLGAIAIDGALRRAGVEGGQVDQVVVGQVLTAGCGQAPHRQAALASGIPASTDVYGVNKVCASGMKALCLAASSVALGHCDTAIAVGMESMSRAPYLLLKSRHDGHRLGHAEMKDSILYDGLTDPYTSMHMGACTERVINDMRISRADQDAYAVESYKRAAAAWKSGIMDHDGIEPVTVEPTDGAATGATGVTSPAEVKEDEEFGRIKLDKVAGLKPSFKRDGTITAANASKMGDGAAAALVMSEEKIFNLDLQPRARILSFADAAVDPVNFALAPDIAIRRALGFAGLETADIYEINEAFSAVVLANMRLLGLDSSRVNVHGGAVSLGHPLGASGLRIVLSLINALEARDARVGCAAVCNGGGGASAIVIERV
ncbi:acetyl- acetyltransferase [Cystoisospora suis]|uniref:Acetyl-acetyltransferase n=1 Tax=Cystoisospora suis TaxID=483139 RepID=A0A2C6LAF8_9APIC|nr:acetyl- acetyltransferase [Cystoisospora suis]